MVACGSTLKPGDKLALSGSGGVSKVDWEVEFDPVVNCWRITKAGTTETYWLHVPPPQTASDSYVVPAVG